MKNDLTFALNAKASGRIQQTGKFALINAAGRDRVEAEVWHCTDDQKAAINYARPRKLRVISSANGASFGVGEMIPVDMIHRTYQVIGYGFK